LLLRFPAAAPHLDGVPLLRRPVGGTMGATRLQVEQTQGQRGLGGAVPQTHIRCGLG
jgi:hypothetical protein